jgi:ribulose-5-phosphate 4-epimerase/fuculose-1-phosphate aldolase
MSAPLSRRRFLISCAVCGAGATLSRVSALALQRPPLASTSDSLIGDVVAANRILARERVLDAFGHVSVRRPGSATRFFLARSVAPELVTAADVLEYDLDANAIDARGGASYRERFIHSEIYRARPDVSAVVHCHTASLIPFGVTGVPLRPVYHQSAFVADGIPLFDIRTAAGMTDMLIENAALGRARVSRHERPPPGASDDARRHDHLPRPGRGAAIQRVEQLRPGVGTLEDSGWSLGVGRSSLVFVGRRLSVVPRRRSFVRLLHPNRERPDETDPAPERGATEVARLT